MLKLFTEHPKSVGETYPEHMGSALFFSRKLFTAGFCCLVHAILPFLFQKTASGIIAELNERMILNRSKLQAPSEDGEKPLKRAA
ncbi:MAG: hypothetical protein RLZ98_2314 [Pseudomonadota bacterium]|jgi:hypothetical protein